MENIKDRLGYYLVGYKKFYSKTLALIESKKTGYEIMWIFNDDIYNKLDWSKTIEESLESIYKRRAQQLRETYDYIILYYSGGSDSGNILKTFVDNNIFLDEIILQIVEPDRKNLNETDRSARNLYGEVEFVAIPEVQKIQHKISPNTKIRIQDIAKPTLEILSKDDWFENYVPGSAWTIGGLARQYLPMNDHILLKVMDKGKKTCHLLGVDKPLVWYDGSNYYAFFSDNNAYHITTVEMNYTKYWNEDYITEFFYWTRDMPEIVIKQAQEIVKECELDLNKKRMWSDTFKKHIGEYRSIMHPIIYPNLPDPKLVTKKPNFSNALEREGLDDWFWATADNKAKSNLVQIIDYLEPRIESNRNIGGNIKNGFRAINSKFYKL